MRVAVIGAGVVGVTTAYELACDGHEVTVLERRGSVAAESSFANAGVVAPGYVTPWAAPDMPMKVLRQLFTQHAPVTLRSGFDFGALPWLWKWWRACRGGTYQSNRLRMQRLANFSRDRLHLLTRDLRLDYEHTLGFLVLLRTTDDLTLARPGLKLLAETATAFRLLDAAACRAVEPGLNPEMALHAGVHLPSDEVGNCRQFSNLLRTEAQKRGVQFRFHTEVQHVLPGAQPQLVHVYSPPQESTQMLQAADHDPKDPLETQPQPFEPVTEPFDAIIVCNALGAPALLRPHGLHLPLQAVHGYSVTAPLREHESHPDIGPRSGLMDERYKVAISRLGSRVRVAGSAEIGGSLERYHTGALDTLYKVLHDWFPGAARMNQAQRWKGARPMLPDGPPVLGASGIEGVWLNLGHGASGWALACGSARLLADAIVQRPPRIDLEGLGVERLRA